MGLACWNYTFIATLLFLVSKDSFFKSCHNNPIVFSVFPTQMVAFEFELSVLTNTLLSVRVARDTCSAEADAFDRQIHCLEFSGHKALDSFTYRLEQERKRTADRIQLWRDRYVSNLLH